MTACTSWRPIMIPLLQFTFLLHWQSRRTEIGQSPALGHADPEGTVPQSCWGLQGTSEAAGGSHFLHRAGHPCCLRTQGLLPRRAVPAYVLGPPVLLPFHPGIQPGQRSAPSPPQPARRRRRVHMSQCATLQGHPQLQLASLTCSHRGDLRRQNTF